MLSFRYGEEGIFSQGKTGTNGSFITATLAVFWYFENEEYFYELLDKRTRTPTMHTF
jgi:hypothetical protein